MPESLKSRTVSGVFWSGVERFSVQAVQLVIGILIARVLSPTDYGIVGMLAIFLSISQMLISSGFVAALIRKIDRTQTDCSTVFYFNILVGFFLYFILFFSAPLIAAFFKTPILIPITRVLAFTLVFNSLTVVQRALLIAKVDFKTQAKVTFLATILSGALGIWMAYHDYGVWALVAQAVVSAALTTLLLWFFGKWQPSWVFSWSSFWEMFSFGSKLIVSRLIETLYHQAHTLIIAKVYSSRELGLYARAQNFADFPSSNITGIFSRVTYPLLCELQDDEERLCSTYRSYLRLSAYIIFPMTLGLSVLATPLILVLLTEKWAGSIIFLQILCFSMMWIPVHAINLNILQVKGRSDLILRIEIIKKIMGIAILCITAPISVKAMCIGAVFFSTLSLVINTHYTGILLNLSFLKQMRDLAPTLIQSFLMGGVVLFFTHYIESNLVKLLAGASLGAVFYIFLSYICRSHEQRLLLSLIPVDKIKGFLHR